MNEVFKKGRLYFIKNEFFSKVNDSFLKTNKMDSSRPHYFTFQDSNTNLLWVIPCSSQIEKYKNIIQDKISKNKPHSHIQIIKVAGKEQAFLYQDMFPILPKYIDKAYENKYGYMEIKDPKTIQGIEDTAVKIIKLLKRGIKFTPTQPDIIKIERIMLSEVSQEIYPVKCKKSLSQYIVAAKEAAATQDRHKFKNNNDPIK
jgi:hypothetical protein